MTLQILILLELTNSNPTVTVPTGVIIGYEYLIALSFFSILITTFILRKKRQIKI